METNYISSASHHCNQQNNLPSAEKNLDFSETTLSSEKDNNLSKKKKTKNQQQGESE